MKRIILAAATVLVAAAGIGYYLWANRTATGPPLPAVPAELTDPPARKMVEGKRQAVRAAPRSGVAWGELAMAFDAHGCPQEALACYRQALDLDPHDARWPFLLANRLTRDEVKPDKEAAVLLLRRAGSCPGPSS